MQNVKDFGAVGDGITSDTKAIQRAIDAGGEVFFPAGIYKSGTLYLRSNGGLHLETGAIIISGGDEEEWNEVDFCPQNRASEREANNGRHLIVAYQCENVSIEGGIIDGNYSLWLKEMNTENDFFKLYPRNGQLLFFCESRNIRIQNCTLRNGSYWHCFLHGCEWITISGLQIHGDPRVLCNDGIDLDCCRYATISDCVIATGDDAIAIRGNSKALGTELRPTEHITVTNCVLSSAFADSIRLGVGNGTIRSCIFSNIVTRDSNIGVEITPSYNGENGVDIENVSFENMIMDVIRPFRISLSALLIPKNGGEDITSYIRNIAFRNIRGKAEKTSEIIGNDAGEISDLRFTDVSFDYYGRGPTTYLDERNNWGRESTASAFQFSKIKSAKFDNLQINWCANQHLWQYEVEMENSNVEFNNCKFEKGTFSSDK